MSAENPESWPLRPSHSASVSHALCMALFDLLHEEGGGEVSRRAYLKMCGLAKAAELFSKEVSGFFGNQRGEAEDLLEALEERFESKQA